MIYIALGSSMFIGTFLYLLLFIILEERTQFVGLSQVLRILASYFFMVLLMVFAYLPVWFFFGMATYRIIALSCSSARKRLLTALTFTSIMVLYRWLLFELLEKPLVSDTDIILLFLGPVVFVLPAVVAIYKVDWLDVLPEENKIMSIQYDDILDQ